MDPWEVLGIEPCRDRKRIKKAYAAKLKRTNPEDDPEAFQRLRQAYEMVLEFLDFASKADARAKLSLPAPLGEERPKSPTKLNGQARHATEPEPEEEDAVSRLMVRARDLSTNKAFERGDSDEKWREVLEDDALWNLETRSAFEHALFHFLVRSKVRLDHRAWIVLEEAFHWREQGLSLYRRGLDRAGVEEVLERIHDALEWRRLGPVRERDLFGELTESRGKSGSVFERLGDLFEDYRVLMMIGAGLMLMRFVIGVDSTPPPDPRFVSSDPVERLAAAAELGRPDAQAALGDRYASGDGVQRNVGMAVELYKSASELSHAYAQRRLADSYREGWIERDVEAAFNLYRLAAQQNDDVAQWWLGYMYFHGLGTAVDDVRGFYWMQRSAILENPRAQAWVGSSYELGRGTDRDMAAAVRWYRRAASADEHWAQLQLARLYIEENGVDRDEDEAIFWLSLATQDPNLVEGARKLEEQLGPLDADRRRALEERLDTWEKP